MFVSQISRKPTRLDSGQWNCTGSEWHRFKPHLQCNLKTECEGGEDEAECHHKPCHNVGFLVDDRLINKITVMATLTAIIFFFFFFFKQSSQYASNCFKLAYPPGAGIMEADDGRQVTTVFTAQLSFHHRRSTNGVS